MNVRLVVSDVDGTLVDHDKRLGPATADAVRRLRGAGTGFTIISARPRSGMMRIADTLGVDGPMGAFNGGTVFHRDGRVDEQHRVPGDVARGMLELAGDSGASTWVFADDRWHADDPANPHVPREVLSAGQDPVLGVDPLTLADRADKITFVSDAPEVLVRLTAEGRARFGGRATIGRSQAYYLDVTATEANKGAGIAALAEAAGVPLDQVMAIGDMDNDVAMLERAGLAVAMGQAADGVKAVADWVTASNEEDGVARAIDRLLAEG